MTSTSTATALIGNTYPSNPTDCSYLDLSSTTNIIPGGVLATKIQRTTLLKTFSNVYSEYSSNFRTSFKAQSANVMVEFRAIVRADNKYSMEGFMIIMLVLILLILVIDLIIMMKQTKILHINLVDEKFNTRNNLLYITLF
jgi:hypothetical protein